MNVYNTQKKLEITQNILKALNTIKKISSLTDAKEGLVCWAYNTDAEILNQWLLFCSGKETDLKSLSTSIKNKPEYGFDQLPLFLKTILKKRTSQDINTLKNSISCALVLKKHIGTISRSGIDQFKNNVAKFWGLGKGDKWCPADIFIFKTKENLDSLAQLPILNTKDRESLNSKFESDILAISLKQETAQYGSGEGILHTENINISGVSDTQENANDILKSIKEQITSILKENNLSERQSYVSLFTQNQFRYSVHNLNQAIGLLEKLIDLIEKINSEKLNKKEKFNKINQNIESFFIENNASKILQKDLLVKKLAVEPVNKPIDFFKSKLDLIKKQISESKQTLSKIDSKYNNAAPILNAKKFIKEEIKNLISGIKSNSSGWEIKFSNQNEIENIDNLKVDFAIQKATCYYLISQSLTKGNISNLDLNVGAEIKSKLPQDPFLAITAYCLSATGAHPTYRIVQGKSSGEPGSELIIKGQTSIEASENKTITITDNPSNGGVSLDYEVKHAEIKIGIRLEYRFNSSNIRVVVKNMKVERT